MSDNSKHRVSVTQNSPNRCIMYLQPETLGLLNSMSERGEIVSGRVTDDELPAIASLPMTDERKGYSVRWAGKYRVNGQIIAKSDDVPPGIYEIDPEETVFEDDLDWFILREVKDKKK